jgi:hypothetical protein
MLNCFNLVLGENFLKYRRFKARQSLQSHWLSTRKDAVKTLTLEELRKAILALNLSVAQIDLSMTEGSYSVDALIDSFNFMREGLESIRNHVVNDDVSDLMVLKSHVLSESSLLSDKVTSSIIAFQFYDRLSQRLHHVSDSLSSLSDIIGSENQIIDEAVWLSFIEKMSKYAAMREEHELFELIFTQGLSSDAAIEQMKIKMRERLIEAQNTPSTGDDDDDDIEFF